jgi:Peptidase A4 family
MTTLEALRAQTPYELIPTSLPGVYASPAPPDDLDPHTATPSALQKHGLLWRRPAPTDDPGLVAAWKTAFARKWQAKDRIVPQFEVQPGKTHQLRAMPRQVTDNNYVGKVWAGAGIKTGSWTAVIGYWNVPTVSKPSEPQGTEGGWNSSSWIGIDGFFISGDVLQAGIQQRVLGNGQIFYVPWYEWYAPPPNNPQGPVDGNGYPLSWVGANGTYRYIYQTNITNMPVNPGDQMYCAVQYINNKTAGQLYLANQTTGTHFGITLAPPPTASFNGSSVEWIMEAPDGGEPRSSLPKFTPVTFTSAVACGPNNASGNPQTADSLNIETASNQVITSVSLAKNTTTITFTG